MKRKEIERKLSSAVSQITPKDGFERISEKLDSAPIQNERTVIKMTENKKKTFKNFTRVAVAACLILAIGLFSVTIYGNNLAVDSIVDLDINPSIELATNKQEKVIKVTAVNEEANAILDGMELKNTDLKVAVNAIIGSMVQKGYFDDIDNSILVTVQNKDEQKAASLQKKLAVNIDETLNSYHVEASVINQTVSEDTSAEDLAKELGISIGKANFIQNLVKKDASLKAEDLAKMSIKELASVVNEKKIDISDIADYDVDDSIWENIADSIEEVNDDAKDKNVNADKNENATVNTNKNENANNNAAVPQNVISAEKAKEIALNHAGVAADKAVFEKVELDRDDGIQEYEVDFRVDKVEYDYEINAVSGKVIKAEKEIDDDKNTQAIKPVEPDETQNSNAEIISAEKAKEIALNHAGLSADKVSFFKVELDNDDGVYVYEIEFIYERMDYEYEINAVSGAIIHSEKEIADFD